MINKYLNDLENAAGNLNLKGFSGASADMVLAEAARRGMTPETYLRNISGRSTSRTVSQGRETIRNATGVITVTAVRAQLAGNEALLGDLPFFVGFPASQFNDYQDLFARFLTVQGITLTVARTANTGNEVLTYTDGTNTASITVSSQTYQFAALQQQWQQQSMIVDTLKYRCPAASLEQLGQALIQARASAFGLEVSNPTTPETYQSEGANITNLVTIKDVDFTVGSQTGLVNRVGAGVTDAEGVTLTIYSNDFSRSAM